MCTVPKFTAVYLDSLKAMCRPCERELRLAGNPARPGCDHEPKAEYEVSQADSRRSLRCFVKKSGARSLGGRYRRPKGASNAGDHAKLVLCSWPGPNALKTANMTWSKAQDQLDNGIDPGADKKQKRLEAQATAANTVAVIAERWFKKEGCKHRTGARAYHDFKRLILPKIGNRPAASIRPQADVATLHSAISERNGGRMADQVCGMLVRLINKDAATSDDVNRRTIPSGLWKKTNNKRTRVLVSDKTRKDDPDHELREVWNATSDFGQFGVMVKVYLLTGLRHNALKGLRWDEVNGRDLLIPAERNKGTNEKAVDFLMPLPQTAFDLIDAQPRNGPYVFTTNGRTPIANMDRPKKALDAASGVIGWTIHDLRRTVRTIVERGHLGIRERDAEAFLGHAVPGVKGVYNAHDYLEEKRVVGEKLAAEIARIVSPNNIVKLRGA